MRIILSLLLGALFGSVLIFSEAFHWQRIQEMFHFESFHMYGLLFSAIGTGLISLIILKKFRARTVYGNELKLTPKPKQRFGNVLGGLIFGSGWAITGTCTAPVFILIGFKWQIGLIVLAGALLGVLLFGLLKSRLPE
jgi:uncharacterized membrane protein YedE/YeeE